MINSLNLYNTYANQGTNALVQTAVDKTSEQSVKNQQGQETQKTGGQHLYLSSKAQKLNALTDEFFSGKGISSFDVDALVERVYQYGLISKSEYSGLSDKNATNVNAIGSGQPSEKISTQTLVDFIDDFQQRLEHSEDDDEVSSDTTTEQAEQVEEENQALTDLKTALEQAKTILSDVELAKQSPDFKQNITQTIDTFKGIITTTAFEKMSLDDKVSLSNVEKTLEIIDKISPSRLSNSKVNQYMNISLK